MLVKLGHVSYARLRTKSYKEEHAVSYDRQAIQERHVLLLDLEDAPPHFFVIGRDGRMEELECSVIQLQEGRVEGSACVLSPSSVSEHGVDRVMGVGERELGGVEMYYQTDNGTLFISHLCASARF